MYEHEWKASRAHFDSTAPDIEGTVSKAAKWLQDPLAKYQGLELSSAEVAALVDWVRGARRFIDTQHESGCKTARRVSSLLSTNGGLMVENGRLAALAYPMPEEGAS